VPHCNGRYATNGYNAKPPRPHKKGARFTTSCKKCRARIYPGLESFGKDILSDGIGKDDLSCAKCAGVPLQGKPKKGSGVDYPARARRQST
jgi:hypothetical protein